MERVEFDAAQRAAYPFDRPVKGLKFPSKGLNIPSSV